MIKKVLLNRVLMILLFALVYKFNFELPGSAAATTTK